MFKKFPQNIFITLFLFLIPFIGNAEKHQHYTILILGDSLTEVIGIDPTMNYPSLVERKLNQEGLNIKVINGGVSGSTTASALSRLQWYKRVKPDMLILALGANDGLRGLQTSEMEHNLGRVIEEAQKNKIKVVLAGMKVPLNYGEEYTTAYDQVFKNLATQHALVFSPFLLKDVALIPESNISDGIHPN